MNKEIIKEGNRPLNNNNKISENQPVKLEKNNNLNNKEEDFFIKSSFSPNISDTTTKDLINEEKDYLKRENTFNETVLDKKISKEITKEGNLERVSTFVQSNEVNKIQKSLRISLNDVSKNNDYLSVRIIPSYNEKEFESIKKI